MFRATMYPSSGETTVFMRHLVLVILCGWLVSIPDNHRHRITSTKYTCGWLSCMHTRQSSIQNNKYQVSHKYSCFSRWWVHSRPKHVEIDKYTKNKLCTNLALFTRLDKTVGVYDTNLERKGLKKAFEILCIVCSSPFRSHILANRSVRRGFFQR